MLELREKQRDVLIDKLPDLANVAAGALVFGQYLGGQGFSVAILLTGAVLWILLMGLVMVIAGEVGNVKRRS